MDFNALLDSLNSSQTNTNNNSQGSDSSAQIMQYVDSIGDSMSSIMNAKSQAEAQIAQIKAAQKETANNVALQNAYNTQLSQMTMLVSLLQEKQKKAQKSSNTGLYIALGVGAVAVLGLLAVVVLKK